MSDRAASGGYTLFELLCVLALIGLVLSTSLPSLSRLTGRDTVRVARRIEGLLQDLVISARASHAPATLDIRRGACSLKIEGPIRRSEAAAFPRDVAVRLQAASAVSVKCTGAGACTPASIVVSGDDAHCRLTISLRGRIARRCRIGIT